MAEAALESSMLPRLNPCYFFQRKEFEGERGKPDLEPGLPANIEIFADSANNRSTLLESFSMVTLQRHGVLRGEYVVHPNGTILFDRLGNCVVINSPPENYFMANQIIDLINGIWEDRNQTLNLWDHFKPVENAAVMSSTFSRNYYHFTLDLVAGFRFLDGYGAQQIVMPTHCLARKFQTDLLSRVMGSRQVVPMTLPKRVRDPVLVQSCSSQETLLWLRKTSGLGAPAGSKRYYIVRRREERVPFANNLSESEEFLRLLDEYGFERVDFGRGEYTIAQQVAMLAGAQVVLGISGANLTNLSYLSPPLSVVEVMATNRISSANMHTSGRLGFGHYAIVSEHFDGQGNVIVDPVLLRRILERATSQIR